MEGIRVKETIKQNIAKRGMAQVMQACWNGIPHFVQMTNARADNLIEVKKEVNLTYNDLLIKCVVNAVKKAPKVNSTLEGENWIIYEDINVSVAVISEYGLFVPVIKNAGEKNVDEISAIVKEVSDKAAKGVLTLDDMALGTITVSNLGATGVETGTPIINMPQGALVFIGNIRKVPLVDENDQIVVGHEIGFSVAFDHRFIDGMLAQEFTTSLKLEIEQITKEGLY